MELRFLGTGAADWPDKEPVDGAFYRHHASMLVNGKVLIDIGPGIVEYLKTIPDIDFGNIEAIFLTHTHEDHWSTDELGHLLSLTRKKIRLYFHTGAKNNLDLCRDSIHGHALSNNHLRQVVLCPMRRWQIINESGLSWQNLEANHYAPKGERGSHYIISDGTETWFYGLDGGWFTTKTWDIVRNTCFDGMVLDGTVGENSADYRIAGHNSLAMNSLLKKAMLHQNMLKAGARLYLSHFGMTTYENSCDIREKVEEAGFMGARDGEMA